MSEINIDSTYGVIVIKDFKPVYVDENYARIFGYQSADELLSEKSSILDIIAPEFHDVARQNYYDLISGKMVPRGRTYTNINKKGQEFTVFTIDHVIEWQGEPAVQVTVIDLSVVVEANRKMTENEKKYKELITRSAQGILVHRDFKPLMVNDAWVRLMRAESADMVMNLNSILSIIPESQIDDVIGRYQKLITGEALGENHVIENVCFDGERRFFNIYDNVIEWDGEPALQVVLEDVTEKVELERELSYKAFHDYLTDLYNREATYRWIKERWSDVSHMSCILLDIDDFKHINDTWGHNVGDGVIRSFAHICREVVDNDIIDCDEGVVGRWGGEEFIIFLHGKASYQAANIAEQIRAKCESTPYHFNNTNIYATMSIGISSTNSFSQCRPKDLIKQADEQMYLSKAKGKNRVTVLAAV